jgi:hypothetical protein
MPWRSRFLGHTLDYQEDRSGMEGAASEWVLVGFDRMGKLNH